MMKQLLDKSADELKKELLELRKEQFNLRMQKSMGETPRSHLFANVRRNIARAETILRQKERQS